MITTASSKLFLAICKGKFSYVLLFIAPLQIALPSDCTLKVSTVYYVEAASLWDKLLP
mgnify:CR=1 FL=1